MNMERSGGILLHISSLPGKYGIGSFGKQAYKFVDFLKDSGIKLWQICPLGPTGFGNSPYQSYSAFAGNPLFIDLEVLVSKGFLKNYELETDVTFSSDKVEFEKIQEFKTTLFRKAFIRFDQDQNEFIEFRENEKDWLDDYALFMSLKKYFSQKSWLEWDEEIKSRKEIEKYSILLANEILFQKFLQFQFFQQWNKLRDYANSKNVKIIGDIPIYVAADSADVWSNPSLFLLDENQNPQRVAGYPPDDFSETGQFWGNPIFDWQQHKNTNFTWWKKRIASSLKMYDMIRLDHFLGFVRYWSIPANDDTAKNGKWVEGPKDSIFSSLKDYFGKLPIIAEDLGNITEDVTNLRDKYEFPGMKILQFAFGNGNDNLYLPHNVEKRSVIYTGTHDNETSEGWYNNIPQNVKDHLLEYIQKYSDDDISWKMINSIWDSSADFAIAPMQDFLSLDNSARFNTPGTLADNWIWRMDENSITENLGKKILRLNFKWKR